MDEKLNRRRFLKGLFGTIGAASHIPITGEAASPTNPEGERISDKWFQLGTGTTGKPTRKKTVQYDVVVIGAGMAGCSASVAAARTGAKTLLVTTDPSSAEMDLFRNENVAIGSYLTIDLEAPAKGKATTLGAIVKVNAGALTQIKRSGSGGAPYSRSFNRYVHFGLGKHTGPVTIEVTLSNGKQFEQKVDTANQIATFKF